MTSREIQNRNAYDTLAKEFIRDTRVLAYMFKDCVPAFSSSSIEEIRSGIEANHERIDHAGGEIPLASGAKIIPDLLFSAKQMKGNVDFQKDKPSYSLEARIAAYASALLCHQIDPPIDYDRILPVLSIWITNYYEIEHSCLRASTNYETIRERDRIKTERSNNDFINWCVFEIGNTIYEDDLDSARILHYQFKCTDEKEAAKQLAKYGIDTEEDRKRWKTMCNLSEGIYEHGHHDGKIEGKIEGRIEGKIEGKIEGRIEGKIEGKIEQAISTIFAAMKKFNISMDDAFEIFTENLTPSEKEEVAKEIKRKLN